MKLYMARDEDIHDEDGYVQKGKIHLFYDTPILNLKEGKWGYARKIGEIPSYMYPELKEKKCITLVSNNLIV